MSVINLPFNQGQPIILVRVGVSAPRAQVMQQGGLPVPQPVLLAMLIDTGASHTSVDSNSVQPLGLIASGVVGIQTPSTQGTPHQCNVYDVSLTIAGAMGIPFSIDAMPVIESVFSNQGIQGLIGRDVLSQCSMHYNGPGKFFSISF